MFIVYSPEGQSFIGAAQVVPSLKVDQSKRINPVEENVLDGLNVDQGQEKHHKKSAAINAYLANQNKNQRRVVVRVSEIMSSPVEVIAAANTLEEAWQRMREKNIAHLPVMTNGRLVGICSQTDLLGRVIVDRKGALEGVKQELVADIMQTHVVATKTDTDIRHVALILSQYRIGALVIMNDQDKPVGIVTRGDLIMRLAKEPPVELYV